jgi:hypothetical protein
LDPVQQFLVLEDGKKILVVRARGIVQLLDHQANVLGFTKIESVDSASCVYAYLEGSSFVAVFSDGLLVRLAFIGDLQIEREERLVASGSVQCAEYQRGKLVFAGKDILPSVFVDGKVEWQAPKPKPDSLGLPVKVDIRRVVFLPDGRIACGTSKGALWVYDPALPAKTCKVQEKTLLSGGIPITGMVANGSQCQLFVGGLKGSLETFSLPELKALGGFGPAPDGSIQSLVVGHRVIVSASVDRFIRIHDLADGKRRRLLQKMFLGHQPCAISLLRDDQLRSEKGDEEDEDDELWSGMKAVKDRPIA